MDQLEQKRFDNLYSAHCRELKLQGMRPKTIDGYSRALRRVADFFGQCPDSLSPDDFKRYFAALVDSHSWSAVKIDRCGLMFFWKHVLNKEWDWVKIVKPPKVHSLPDLLTSKEAVKVISSIKKLRYRVYFLCIYSMGLRLSEALNIQISDIDANRKQLHVRNGKGGKDRFVYLPTLAYRAMQYYWVEHKNKLLIFPNMIYKNTDKVMDKGGVQLALQATLKDCGIRKRITVHTLRHCYATHLLEAGINLRYIQEQLGHAKPETTARYTHLTNPAKQDSAAAIEILLHDIKIV